MTTKNTDAIQNFLIEQIAADDRNVVRHTQDKFGVSRQAVNRHLRNMIAQGSLTATGYTRQRSYHLALLTSRQFQFKISPDLHEDQVWRDHVRPLLDNVPDNVLRICNYGFTEMLNNAIDHSEGTTVLIIVEQTAAAVTLTITDNGIGIFRKIQRALGLEDERYTLLELTKGKLTTDPTLHTGQGIFFTSRSFDKFSIMSGALFFSHTGQGHGQDWLLEDQQAPLNGTAVMMRISVVSTRQLREVFDRYTAEADEYGFSRTIVPVTLARFGDENLISRSQAKRLLARFERFQEVLLDFESVEFIGQAFADEVFRVFHNRHPEVNLTWMNTNPSVESTIIGSRAAPAS